PESDAKQKIILTGCLRKCGKSLRRPMGRCHPRCATTTLKTGLWAQRPRDNNEFKELRCFGRLSLYVFLHGCMSTRRIVVRHGNVGYLNPSPYCCCCCLPGRHRCLMPSVIWCWQACAPR